jgi:hypothetical protein
MIKHTNTDDTSGQQRGRVIRQSQRTKDTWSIVQHGINTSPLLEKHSHRSDNDTTKHGHSLEQRTNSDKLQLEHIPSSLFLQVREFFCCRALLKH